MIAPLLPDEVDRLDTLRAFGVLDTAPEPEYDDITRLAATVCGTPIALISLLDADRQWFKARVGIDAAETPRDIAFCSHAILQKGLFVVPDAAADKRFQDNPLVTGEPGIRFYAGMPLAAPDGHSLGTLCVIDRTPRDLTDDQCRALRVLARQVVTQFMLRRQVEQLKAAEAALRASEERFRAFMDHSPANAFMKDEDGRYVYLNAPCFERFGIAEADWLGKTDAELFPPHIADPLRATDLGVLATGETVKVVETAPTPDGVSEFWQAYKFPFTDKSGRQFLAGMAVDVTAETRAEAKLRASEAKFRNTVDRLAEGVFVIDVATRGFVEVNAAIVDMLGYTAAEFLALSPFDIVAGETPEVFARNVQGMDARLAKEGRCDLGRRRFRWKDGAAVPVDVRVTVVPNGGAGLHAVIVRDVTEQVAAEDRLFEYQLSLEEANAKLKALSVTDGLTGVKNRAALTAKLTEEFDRSTRYGHSLSVILMDVDHFKLFNDTFGHPAGDEVLRAVAGTLQATVRTVDFVARYGGEEFAVILPDTDYSGAMVLAERCRRVVAGRAWDKRAVTISVGVTTLTADTPDADALVQEADDALYASKQAGRNRVSHRRGAAPALALAR